MSAPPANTPKGAQQEKGQSAEAASSKPASPLFQKESGNALRDAVVDLVDRTAAPFQALATKPKDVFDVYSKAQAVVGAVAGLANAHIEFLNDAFARATSSVAKVFPSFPAATAGMPVIGVPHLHTHPPAMPAPLPGIGLVSTGCPSVLIGGVPAARSGDFGVSPTCGSVSPVFEIFTGSSNVFIGGARAARMTDFTRACTPAAPAAGAAQAAGAVSKLGKAMSTANKIVGGAGKVALVMNIGGGFLKMADTQMKMHDAAAAAAKADAAAAKADADESAQVAAVNAQAQAAAAAGEALGAAIGAMTLGASLLMDMLRESLGKLMGKDPGTPPCIGMVAFGIPTVFIGGFPMPSWSDVAKGLKKLFGMLPKPRRKGATEGAAEEASCSL